MELTVRIDMAKLHCPRCDNPLKPPIFEFLCDGRHLACSDCHGELPKDKCYACGQEGAYRRNTTLEDVVGWHKILCPYDVYGCRISVPYHESSSHQRECPCAPCGCPEPGCTFAASPPMLHGHLRDAHGWAVDKIRYGQPLDLRLPESQRRWLLVAEQDGRVFLVVAVGAPGECHEVSLVPESERGGGAAVHVQGVGDGECCGTRQRAEREDEDRGPKLRGARRGRGGAPGCASQAASWGLRGDPPHHSRRRGTGLKIHGA